MMVPYFVLVNEGSEPCSTDVLVSEFDFGDVTEKELDLRTENLAVGEEIDVVCADSSYDDPIRWVQTLRRVS